jgi:hypothetical protein
VLTLILLIPFETSAAVTFSSIKYQLSAFAQSESFTGLPVEDSEQTSGNIFGFPASTSAAAISGNSGNSLASAGATIDANRTTEDLSFSLEAGGYGIFLSSFARLGLNWSAFAELELSFEVTGGTTFLLQNNGDSSTTTGILRDITRGVDYIDQTLSLVLEPGLFHYRQGTRGGGSMSRTSSNVERGSSVVTFRDTEISVSDPLASTIDVRLDDFGPSGVMGYHFNGSETIYGSAGQFRFHTQNPVGNAAEGVSPNAVGFCIELTQTFTSDFISYNVGDLTTAQEPVGLSGPISPEQAALIEQLWALHYDADWRGNGALSTDDITRSMAFSALLYEIIYDFDGVSLASMDLGSGLFQLVDGFILDKNDPTQELPVFDVASFFLGTLSLNYTGPRPQLLALTNAAQQDYLVMVVPEVGTFPLVSAVVVAFGGISLARRFRREAK